MPNKIHVIGIKIILINCSITYSTTPTITIILKNGSTIFRVIPLIFILFPPNIFLVRHIGSAYQMPSLIVIRNALFP